MRNTTRDPTVLIVDDEAEIVELIEAFVPDHVSTRTATTKGGALESFDSAIDLAFLDRRLPDGSGDEIVQEIRDSPHDCQVAMVSAVSEDYNQQEMAYDEYIAKPFTSDDIEAATNELLPGETA